jgi:hypothetical protein
MDGWIINLNNWSSYFYFQLETHESLLNVRSLNIQFFIHLQQAVSKQIQDCTQHVKVSFWTSKYLYFSLGLNYKKIDTPNVQCYHSYIIVTWPIHIITCLKYKKKEDEVSSCKTSGKMFWSNLVNSCNHKWDYFIPTCDILIRDLAVLYVKHLLHVHVHLILGITCQNAARYVSGLSNLLSCHPEKHVPKFFALEARSYQGTCWAFTLCFRIHW